jgi:hypothetical protein
MSELSQAKPKQDALFHPDIHPPRAIHLLSGADFPAGQQVAKLQKRLPRIRPKLLCRSQPFNLRLQRLHGKKSIKDFKSVVGRPSLIVGQYRGLAGSIS